MSFLEKLFGKTNKGLRGNSTIVVGSNARETAKALRAQRVPNVQEWVNLQPSNLTQQGGKVKVLTLCFAHEIPIGVINYQGWYSKVLMDANLGYTGNNPEIKTNWSSDKKGLILLHWDEVDMETLRSTVQTLYTSINKWS